VITDEPVFHPINPEAGFFWWLEAVRAKLPAGTIFVDSLDLHQTYANEGILGAIRLAHSHVVATSKGPKYRPLRDAWEHFLNHLCVLGHEHPKSRKATIKLIKEIHNAPNL
jgi:hypothetical protein